MLALRGPPAVGAKLTAKVQLCPFVRVCPAGLHAPAAEVFRTKSPLFVPVFVMLVVVSEVTPVLVRVTVWAALVVVVA